VESPQRAARHAALYGLHVSAAFAGLVAFAPWIVFDYGPAAVASGATWFAGGLLALLSRHSPLACITRRIAARGALLQAYGAALVTLGGLLLRHGART
jgi:hypothetical protein